MRVYVAGLVLLIGCSSGGDGIGEFTKPGVAAGAGSSGSPATLAGAGGSATTTAGDDGVAGDAPHRGGANGTYQWGSAGARAAAGAPGTSAGAAGSGASAGDLTAAGAPSSGGAGAGGASAGAAGSVGGAPPCGIADICEQTNLGCDACVITRCSGFAKKSGTCTQVDYYAASVGDRIEFKPTDNDAEAVAQSEIVQTCFTAIAPKSPYCE